MEFYSVREAATPQAKSALHMIPVIIHTDLQDNTNRKSLIKVLNLNVS